VAGMIMTAAVVIAIWAMRQDRRTRQRLRADG
jgi:hypothetical protein